MFYLFCKRKCKRDCKIYFESFQFLVLVQWFDQEEKDRTEWQSEDCCSHSRVGREEKWGFEEGTRPSESGIYLLVLYLIYIPGLNWNNLLKLQPLSIVFILFFYVGLRFYIFNITAWNSSEACRTRGSKYTRWFGSKSGVWWCLEGIAHRIKWWSKVSILEKLAIQIWIGEIFTSTRKVEMIDKTCVKKGNQMILVLFLKYFQV